MKESSQHRIQIKGMHCSSCAAGISKHLNRIGATEVNVDFTSSSARFELQADQQLPQIIKEIRSLGYHVIENDHTHGDGHDHGSSTALKIKFVLSALFTLPLLFHMFPAAHALLTPTVQLALCTPVFIIGFFHFGLSTISSLRMRYLTMDVLIFIGITAAFTYSVIGLLQGMPGHELFFETSATITTIVLLGNLLEEHAARRASASIEDLATLLPQTTRRVINNGQTDENIESISYTQIVLGDILLVSSGDKIPCDGRIIEGSASIDESLISGESLPCDRVEGAEVIGGTVVASGSIKYRAERTGESTILSQIISLVREAQSKKPRIQRIGDQVSAVFVPVVLSLSALTFVLSYYFFSVALDQSLLRSIAVLVIACPCAMGLATPTAVTVGLGLAARSGVIIRGGDVLESLSKVKKVIFDKTGTLTTGKFTLERIMHLGGEAAQFNPVIKALAQHSSHPISVSLAAALTKAPTAELSGIEESKGVGITGTDSSGTLYALGGIALAKKLNAMHQLKPYLKEFDLFLFKNEKLCSAFAVSDQARADAKQVISALKDSNIEVALLSGDRESKCKQLATKVGLTALQWEKLPQEKAQILQTESSQQPTAYVGDGINDAAALQHATVGISLGGAVQIAIQSAQVILADGRLTQIIQALALSKNTMRIIRQNLFWAFCYNIIAIPFAALGMLNPLYAALAMTASDIIVILNSLRLRSQRMLREW